MLLWIYMIATMIGITYGLFDTYKYGGSPWRTCYSFGDYTICAAIHAAWFIGVDWFINQFFHISVIVQYAGQ